MPASVHKVLSPVNPQPAPAYPVEHYVDPLNGARLRRESLGTCTSGYLVIGQVVKSTGIDLYWRDRHGHSPKRSCFSDTLNRFLQKCWSEMTRKPGTPQYHKYPSGSYWLASLPVIGTYCVEALLEGGCELYRLTPLVRRPRGAVPVTVAASRSG